LTHPRDINQNDIESFLTHLALEKTVASATQNQALSALLSLPRNIKYAKGLG
jgi:hypothetical protein